MLEDFDKQYLINHKQELVRYENDFNADFSVEKKETDKIIHEINMIEIRRFKSKLWEHEQDLKKNTAFLPENQKRLDIK